MAEIKRTHHAGVGRYLDKGSVMGQEVDRSNWRTGRTHTEAPKIRGPVHVAVGSPVRAPVVRQRVIYTHETSALEAASSNRTLTQHHILAGMKEVVPVRIKKGLP